MGDNALGDIDDASKFARSERLDFTRSRCIDCSYADEVIFYNHLNASFLDWLGIVCGLSLDKKSKSPRFGVWSQGPLISMRMKGLKCASP
jgi:hypothetical protein